MIQGKFVEDKGLIFWRRFCLKKRASHPPLRLFFFSSTKIRFDPPRSTLNLRTINRDHCHIFASSVANARLNHVDYHRKMAERRQAMSFQEPPSWRKLATKFIAIRRNSRVHASNLDRAFLALPSEGCDWNYQLVKLVSQSYNRNFNGVQERGGVQTWNDAKVAS